MIEQSGLFAVKPIITYPREVQVGKTYLMTINLEPEEFEWQCEEEEYPVYCSLDSNLFRSKSIGEPVIVLHRFGGSYGEAKFLVVADFEELDGEIKVTLLNRWGVPVQQLVLTGIKTVQDLSNLSEPENSRLVDSPTTFVKEEREEHTEIDNLVESIRKKIKPYIDVRCGAMRVLDMTQPIRLDNIYTYVEILENASHEQRLSIDELSEGRSLERFDRLNLGKVQQKRISGLEAVEQYNKLVILGRPGTGKTTFLKWLAIQCNEGQVLTHLIPLFVSLKDFAEAEQQRGLTTFITDHYFSPELPSNTADSILRQGRGLVLLDGLDEVLERDHDRVLREIRAFTQHYEASHIIMTSRIAAREYVFQQFTYVEMTDFSDEQILNFANKWFKVKEPNQVDVEGNSTVAPLFWQALKEHKSIKELATNPLLLTLLCLEFEESSEFPRSRAELYERSLNVLLRKWDGQRRIKRDEVYNRLSIHRKECLLEHLAMQTFERGEYFFKEQTAKQLIGQYIKNLPDATTDPEALLVDSHAVLKAIESQHGLLTERARGTYSFSHLTFQEYFAARHIVETEEFSQLMQHIAENRWQEIFRLVCERLNHADNLLIAMKTYIDQILIEDYRLQDFLRWLDAKATSITVQYKPATIRALYFINTLGFSSDLVKLVDNTISSESILVKYPNLSFQYAQPRNEDFGDFSELVCDMTLTQALLTDLPTYIDYSLDYELAIELGLVQRNETNVDRNHIVYCACILALELILARASNLYRGNDVEFRHKLEDLRQQLPLSFDAPQQWWANNRSNWVQQLQTVMIDHRNIGHDWQFSNEERKKLQQYYDANNLLFKCLNSDCCVSREVRQRIEANLLLPHTG
ncbi:MAG: hypothetical protein Kow00121_06520 [Elainellaceae cyanobacterium]